MVMVRHKGDDNGSDGADHGDGGDNSDGGGDEQKDQDSN